MLKRETVEANRKVKHRLWDEQAERERRQDALIQSLIDKSMARKRAGEAFDLETALTEFDEARAMAMALKLPGHAAKCTFCKAQLCGLLIERQAILHATTDQPISLTGPIDEVRTRIFENYAGKHGSARAQKLLEFMQDELKEAGDIIDGKAE